MDRHPDHPEAPLATGAKNKDVVLIFSKCDIAISDPPYYRLLSDLSGKITFLPLAACHSWLFAHRHFTVLSYFTSIKSLAAKNGRGFK